MSTIAAIPLAQGLAVHAAGTGRVLPWAVARGLLDDPALVVHTVAPGDCPPQDGERLLCALARGDAAAQALLAAGPPGRLQVQALPRHPRPWAHTIDCSVIAGDVDAACCRAGLALPAGDPLRLVAAIAQLMERHRDQIEVRARLLADHPWIGDAAWLTAYGRLAETVVLQGARRAAVHRDVVADGRAVADLLTRPERFTARRSDVRAAMQAILDGAVHWNERGHLTLLPAGGFQHTVGGTALGLGVGGLHSADAPGVVDGPLCDLDVASYYPSLIANDGIAPPQLPDFAARVRSLLERRLAAKRRGDQAASGALKIVVNSLYGQLGNHRSGLFSPPDALRVVLTGQLRLLQLIDLLLEDGCTLISANTDGVLVRGDPTRAAAAWEAMTGLTLERTAYARLWRTSVNDYCATAPDGSVAKTRGRFAGGDGDDDAARRSAAPAIARAVVERLVRGRPIVETLAGISDVAAFTLWRHARDLLWDGRPVDAPVVRWVVGRGGTPIVQSTAARVTATVATRAIPVPDPAAVAPALIDRAWYATEAQELVDKVLGTVGGARQTSLLDGI